MESWPFTSRQYFPFTHLPIVFLEKEPRAKVVLYFKSISFFILSTSKSPRSILPLQSRIYSGLALLRDLFGKQMGVSKHYTAWLILTLLNKYMSKHKL